MGFGWLSTATAASNTSKSRCSGGMETETERETETGTGTEPESEGTKERQKWAADPHRYAGGSRWRFVILKPKQTVFFPSGTVHFVFRLKSQDSLSVGGHLLRWNGVERWLDVVLEQMGNEHITNEDMEWGVVKKYVDVVSKLVARREKESQKKMVSEKWEGLVKVRHSLAC